jgi:hypothetical protein
MIFEFKLVGLGGSWVLVVIVGLAVDTSVLLLTRCSSVFSDILLLVVIAGSAIGIFCLTLDSLIFTVFV